MVLGFHVCLCLSLTFLLSTSRNTLAQQSLFSPAVEIRLLAIWQWSAYVVALCTFHLLEFFVTVLYNPSVASADSFLVNHSTGYSAAVVTSWIEFCVRLVFFPQWTFLSLTRIGLMGVILSQSIRSLAMASAGESFNHYIQTSKKDNHKLVTTGIYRYLRQDRKSVV